MLDGNVVRSQTQTQLQLPIMTKATSLVKGSFALFCFVPAGNGVLGMCARVVPSPSSDCDCEYIRLVDLDERLAKGWNVSLSCYNYYCYYYQRIFFARCERREAI